MEKRNLIIYRVVTGIFTLMILGGVSQYFFNHAMVAEMFTSLHYPTYLVYVLGVLKLLGLTAIWTNKSKMLKEWAYAGFFFNLSLGVSAHINVNDGEYIGAAVALTLVIVSYIFDRKIYSREQKLTE